MSTEQEYYNSSVITCNGQAEVHVCTKKQVMNGDEQYDELTIQVIDWQNHLVHELKVTSDKVMLTVGGE